MKRPEILDFVIRERKTDILTLNWKFESLFSFTLGFCNKTIWEF